MNILLITDTMSEKMDKDGTMVPFNSETYTYYTDLYEMEECEKILKNALESKSIREDGLKGGIDYRTGTFWLLHHDFFMRNFFARQLNGKLLKNGHGTGISCRFEMSIFVKSFVAIWFGSLLSILFSVLCVCVLLRILTGRLVVVWGVLLAIIGMCLIGILIVFIGVKSSKKNEEYVLNFLESTLFAKRIS